MFQEIAAIHQQVRERIEREEPGWKVTKVDSFGTSDYRQALDNQREIHPDAEFLHFFTGLRFRVYATHTSGLRKLVCDVQVANDGKLHIGDRLESR